MAEWGCRDAYAWLQQTLLNEGGVICFDGLDEVRESDEIAKRTVLKQAITAFAAPLTQCRVVVTCRTYAYRQGDRWQLPESTFRTLSLALFDMPQIRAFATAWYRVVGPWKGWRPSQSEREAENLCAAIENLPHLRDLAQYPLLLTLMAQVHGRDGYLPQDRADLYGRAVNLLLAHWDNRIVREAGGGYRIEPGLIMRLGILTEALRGALERVAFAVHQRQEEEGDRSERTADIDRLDLLEELEKDLGSLDKAQGVIDYIQDRAGLLQAQGNRTYSFPHRSFQEYLAATYLLKQAEFDTMLRDRLQRDTAWWREVFLLAAGASTATPRNIADLVDSLLPVSPSPGSLSAAKAAMVAVAGQALAETRFDRHVAKEAEPGRYHAIFDRCQGWLRPPCWLMRRWRHRCAPRRGLPWVGWATPAPAWA